MVDREHEKIGDRESCEAVEGGYTIFLDEKAIHSFMEAGDYSSAQELEHFKDIGGQIEKRIKEDVGLSLLALSLSENRMPRDFAVLQIAHVLAKHGKRVLIVDCDFLQSGLSGLVENIEEQGFLDLLLYGSSLKSVVHSIGIDGVSITGAGSFPVSRAIPFAQKEFSKVRDFLKKRNQIVIYCATLYTEDGEVNPLCNYADGILLCCQIEEMEEGELKRSLRDLGPDLPPLDLVCFCAKGELIPAGIRDKKKAKEEGKPTAKVPEEVRAKEEETYEPAFIEKTEEVETVKRGWFNLPRIVTVAFAALLVGFLIWWVVINRSIREKESSRKMTELVQKQRDVREAVDKKPATTVVVDSIEGEEGPVAEAPAEKPPVVTKEPVVRAPEKVTPTAGPRYAIHIASFKELSRAGRETEYFERAGYEVRVVEVNIKGEIWFRVLVGNYATREEAITERVEIRAMKRVGYARVVKLTQE